MADTIMQPMSTTFLNQAIASSYKATLYSVKVYVGDTHNNQNYVVFSTALPDVNPKTVIYADCRSLGLAYYNGGNPPFAGINFQYDVVLFQNGFNNLIYINFQMNGSTFEIKVTQSRIQINGILTFCILNQI